MTASFNGASEPSGLQLKEGNGSQRLDHNPKYYIILNLKRSVFVDDESVLKYGWGIVIIKMESLCI